MKKKTDFMDRYLRELKEKRRNGTGSDTRNPGKVVIVQRETPLGIFIGAIGAVIRWTALSILTVLSAVGIIALTLETTRSILVSYFTELIKIVFGII